MGSMLEARLFHGTYDFRRRDAVSRTTDDPLSAARGIVFAALASAAFFWLPLAAWLASRG
jgi:hypothetical protein